MYTMTFFSLEGVTVIVKEVVLPSPMNMSLVIFASSVDVLNAVKVLPSVETSYLPVSVLNRNKPAVAVGRDAVLPEGNTTAVSELKTNFPVPMVSRVKSPLVTSKFITESLKLKLPVLVVKLCRPIVPVYLAPDI